MDLKEAGEHGDSVPGHWYYVSKARAVLRLLKGLPGGTLLDVGAGSAWFSRYFLENTEVNEAFAVDVNYEGDADDAHAGKPLHFRREIDRSEAGLVLMMDVIEHVEDDSGLIRSYAEKVPEGALFVITVPAFSFLWSGHDVFLEHKRRYTLGELEKTVRESGLDILKSCYYFGLVFPVAAASRLAGGRGEARSQLKRHHPLVNSAMKMVCGAELPFMTFNRVAGLTALCLAGKTAKRRA